MNDNKAAAAYHPQQPPGEQVSTNPIVATLKAVSVQVRALREDWHPRADNNSDYQAGYSQAQHDALNIINDTARKEIRK